MKQQTNFLAALCEHAFCAFSVQMASGTFHDLVERLVTNVITPFTCVQLGLSLICIVSWYIY